MTISPALPRQADTGSATGIASGAGTDTGSDTASDTASNGLFALTRKHAAALGADLVRRADEDRRLTRQAQVMPSRYHRDALQACQRENAEALKAIVAEHGWPMADVVGDQASTAALMILLHARDLDFQLVCRDLIAEAAVDGRCPAVHHAYIADHCAVEQGLPQFYGTRIDPRTLRPYPIRQPDTVEERRADVGLHPLDQQMRALRQCV